MSRLRGLLGAALVISLLARSAAADDVEALVTGEMQRHHVAGLECLVVKDGRTQEAIYAGKANLEWNAPVAADTEFEIGSITKQFTAACILILADEGKLSVDDPVGKYLTNAPAAWSGVKIRHLLSHTSGNINYDGLDGFELRQHLTPAEFTAKLAKYPLDFPPGTAWKYSNSGFSLLGFIVADVSGESYWKFLREHSLEPLQMTNTYDRNPQFLIPHRAIGYVFRKGTQTYENRDADLTDLNAAGTIVSTVTDLAKWDAAIQGAGVLAPATKKLWWSPVIMSDGHPLARVGRRAGAYGFGWFLDPEQTHPSIWHTGVTSGFSAANKWYPNDHLTILILSNTDEGGFAGDLADKIAAHYFGEPEKK